MEEYRQNCLTSVVSKTVAKVIVNRLQLVLAEIISPAQSAFIKGRLITDNYLIAHEVAHFIKNTRHGRSVYCSLKLDMSKAYDRVEWGYLELLLLRFGFEARLSKLQLERRLTGIRVSRRAPHVTHIMFANVCLLTFKVEERTAGTLSSLLRKYEKMKTELVLSHKVTEEMKTDLQEQLAVKIVNHHDRYLGLPLSLKRKLTLNFTELRLQTIFLLEKYFQRHGVDKGCAYKLSMQLNGRDCGEEIGNSDHTQHRRFWKDFWKMLVPRKIKIFGWHGFHEALPTDISLYKRGLEDNVGCVVCDYRLETWSHFARKKKLLVLLTLWLIWHNRNKLKHGDKGYTLSELVHKATTQTKTFEQYESKFLSSMRFLYSSEFVWKRPHVEFIKMNCDASWNYNLGGGIGITARDIEGAVLGVRATKGMVVNSSAACEGMGLLESFKMAEQINADKVIFETDCADVVKWFNICPDDSMAREEWFKDNIQFLQRHTEWKIFLIRREANFVADQLAKLASVHNWFWTRLDCCPRLECLSS
ncbi:hypothetical protein QQ045_003157 [Rhodiola kirilowii]